MGKKDDVKEVISYNNYNMHLKMDAKNNNKNYGYVFPQAKQIFKKNNSKYGHKKFSNLTEREDNKENSPASSELPFSPPKEHTRRTEQITLSVAKIIVDQKSKEDSAKFQELESYFSLGASTNLKLKEYKGCTLLHLASSSSSLAVVKYLLKKAEAEDLAILNDEGLNLFHLAIQTQQTELLACLVERLEIEKKPKLFYSLINEKSGSQFLNRTPLHLAAVTHNEEIIRLLVSNNCDGNIRDLNNQTPLELALLSEANEKVLNLLMESTKVMKVMKKCLNNFSIKDCRNVILKLAKLGMNFKLRNRKNNTPLMIAAQFGDVELLSELIELAKQHKTEGLEALDDNFHTALHFSCSWGHYDCVKVLLDAGANIEAADNQGNTPLCRASQWNRADVCKLLLERGANANAVSSFNKTPLELAFVKGLNNCENPHWDVINILLPYTNISALLFKPESSSEKLCFYAR